MAECLNDIMPEIDFVVNSSGITIYCPNRIRMPRFVPFDLRGRCSQCRGDQIDIDYIIQEDGVTIYSTRLKQEKFVPFDWPVPFPENSNKMIRIKQGSKHFTIPIKRSQTRSNTLVIPTALLKSNDGQAKPVNKEVENIKLNELPQIQEESVAEEKPKMQNILKDTIDIVQTAVSAINEKYSEMPSNIGVGESIANNDNKSKLQENISSAEKSILLDAMAVADTIIKTAI